MAVPTSVEPEDDGFPTKQLLALALCRVAEPIAFTSILAYTYPMVKEFQGGDDTNASFYAGLLVSAFAVAEASTAMVWGSISDRYGRKPIIMVGLAGTALSSLIFGFAKNFWVALGARVIGGLLNGNVAVMQTMVAEMCTKPEYEPKAYAMSPFMWSLGTIIGAAMGGYLAQPSRYYPSLFPPDGIFGRYPYLLPNLVAVVFIVLAIIQGYFFLKETNPRFKNQQHQQQQQQHEAVESGGPVSERTPLNPQGRRASVMEIISTGNRRPSFISGSMPTMSEPAFDLRRGSVTTLYEVKPTVSRVEYVEEEEDSPAQPVKAFTRTVVLWIFAIIIFCYHQMAYASLLPIYLVDDADPQNALRAGLGYTVHEVGGFMSINGIIALVIQITIFPFFVAKVGVWKSLVSLTIACPLVYVAIPFLSLLPGSGLSPGIYAILFVQNFMTIIIYPCLLIALKNATPSLLVLGKVNGLAMSASSGARTLAPPITGIIYGAGGAAAGWWSIAAVAVIGIIELLCISRPRDDADVVVENVLRRKSEADPYMASLVEHDEH